MMTKEEKAAYRKSYRAQNPEREAALKKKWRADNKELILAYKRKWKINNPEKAAAHSKKATKKYIENLSDCYVSDSFAKRKNTPYTAKELRQFPDIIETLRLIMKIKRLCIIKNKENENS
tara:strand:+ start:293 stop:652 length:360 start_codon:yes stop_codon:yes gene_type:complete